MSAAGYVRVAVCDAIPAAAAVRAEVARQRELIDEAEIARVMGWKRRHFWGACRPNFTREEALAYLGANDVFGWRSLRGWNLEVTAKEIAQLASASHVDGWVHLSSTAAEIYNAGREILAREAPF